MTENFTRKKVASLTLGEKLIKFRKEARLNVADMAKATKIQPKYIEYLERGEYEKLPANVYVRGYLRSYARYLNIDECVLIRLYDQERNITSNIHPTKPDRNVFERSSARTYTFSSRAFVFAGIGVVVFGVALYLALQFRQFTTDPLLSISEPNPNRVVEGNTTILRGKTDRGTQVTVNNDSTFVSAEGDFEEPLTLQNGLNQITVRAVNRFDKEKIEVIQIEARFEEVQNISSEQLAQEQAETAGLFRIGLSIKETPTKITVISDGQKLFEGVLGAGDPQFFSAKEELLVSAENGADVLVQTTPDGPKEPLGANGPVQEKSFKRSTGSGTEA